VETSPALTVCDLAERSQEYDGRVIAVRGEFAIRGGIQILRAFGCQTKGTRAIAEVTFEDAGEEGTPLPSPDAESAQLAVVLTVRGRFQRSDNGGGQSAGKLLFAETLEPEVRRRR
jgi:hypothetical protein